MNAFETRIYPLLKNSGKTDKYLEEELNLPRGIIYKWKTGKNKNYKFYITEIASFFHVSTDYLLGKTDDPSPAGEKKSPPAQVTVDDVLGALDGLSKSGLLAVLAKVTEELQKNDHPDGGGHME